MDVRKRIIHALEKSGKTRQDLADKLDRGRAAVSDMLNKEGEFDSLKYLEATAELTGFTFQWLRTGEGPETETELRKHLLGSIGTDYFAVDKNGNEKFIGSTGFDVSEQASEYLKGNSIRPVTVTVDRTGKELITYVPVKAQAGYRRGFSDPQFLQQLPAFSLPILISQTTTHRMFQVDGNSMRQLGGGGLNDGDVVISAYVEDIIDDIKDNRVYVVITTDGTLIKRVFNRLKTAEKVLVLNSDNKSGEYGPIIVHPHEILEVWEYKAHISRQLSFSVDLWEALTELQAKQAIQDDKIKFLEEQLRQAKSIK